jgi:UDP:flavonoid glycosyltransferase YjiC (YdhE family)
MTPMRFLMTTTGYPGHLLPMVPFARALAAAGHDVCVAAPDSSGTLVRQSGLAFWSCADLPEGELGSIVGSAAQLPRAGGHARMIGEGFGRVAPRALLPDLLGIVDEWRPDLVVSESQELAGGIAAECHGLPHARVALGLASNDEETRSLVADPVDDLRAELGLPPGAAAERLRSALSLTTAPPVLDDGTGTPATHRFREATAPRAGGGGGYVYLTFGSVAASLGFFPELYRSAIDSLAALDAGVLVTVGPGADPAALGALPPNVHVERWMPQEEVAARADAIVCHGGYGSMLGALAHGIPLVAVPLFGGDQWRNAHRLAELGAGIALGDDSRLMFEPPPAAVLAALPDAVDRVVTDPAYRHAAERIAREIAFLPPVGAAVHVLQEFAAQGRAMIME